VLPQVDVTDTGSRHESSYYAEHKGHKYERRTIRFRCGDEDYGIHYRACVDELHGDQVGVVEGYLGMPKPSGANWYGGGFLRIILNGDDVGTHRLASMHITERGERGGCELVWETPQATVRTRFLLTPGANHLKCEVLWTPNTEIKSGALRLLCYPSFFTAARKRDGDRHVITPRIDQIQGKSLKVDPEQDAYFLYCDTIFDPARGEGEGACAMMFLPEAVTGGSVSVGGYGTSTMLHLRPEAGRARLAFWEFPGMPNAEALAWLQQNAGRVRTELAATDFRTRLLVDFDAARCRAEVDRLAGEAGEAGRPHGEAILTAASRVEVLQAKGRGGDWRLEKELTELLPGLERQLWQLRIQALLSRGDAM